MIVFLSHAISDKDLVKKLKTGCTRNGIQLLVAEHSISVDKSITEKIELMIRQSKVALFLLTAKGNESKFVHQEIGYARSIKKPSLYIVQKGSQVTGFAFGHDYIELDPDKPNIALSKATNRLKQHLNKIIEEEKREKDILGTVLFSLIGIAILSR